MDLTDVDVELPPDRARAAAILKQFTAQQLIALVTLGAASLSPDGRRMAYVVTPISADRSSITVVDCTDGTTVDAAGPGIAGVHSARLAWSPDGQRLAVIASRPDAARLWVWLAAGNRLSEFPAITLADGASADPGVDWIDAHRLLLVVDRDGANRRSAHGRQRQQAIVAAGWRAQADGRTPSSIVLESGPAQARPAPGNHELTILDVVDGSRRVLASAARFAQIALSPDRETVAYACDETGDSPVCVATAGPRQCCLGVADLRTAAPPEPERVAGAIAGSILWAPDSSRLAFLLHDASTGLAEVCIADTGNPRLAGIASTSIRLAGDGVRRPDELYAWCGGQLLVAADLVTVPADAPRPGSGWYIGSAGASLTPFGPLAAAALASPRSWDGSATLLAIAQDRLAVVDGRGNVTQSFAPDAAKVTDIVWAALSHGGPRHAIVRCGNKRQSAMGDTYSDLLCIRTDDGAVRRVIEPGDARQFRILEVAANSGELLLRSDDRNGTRLWLAAPPAFEPRLLAHANAGLRDYAEASTLDFTYSDNDGDELTARVLLPEGHDGASPLPVVVSVYPGQRGGLLGADFGLNQATFINLQMFTSNGYAVLIPSMPKSRLSSREPYSDLPAGVLPAIDWLIESGIADPARLGVIGYSAGGTSAVGLISQTERFKAAVSIAGACNFISYSGAFDPGRRYSAPDDDPTKSARTNLYDDLGYHLRNSPIAHAARIQTPLLIVQGDFDSTSIQQGEECYAALHRLGKSVKFVRYLGEDHFIASPANIVDFWSHVLGWFDAHVGESAHTATTATRTTSPGAGTTAQPRGTGAPDEAAGASHSDADVERRLLRIVQAHIGGGSVRVNDSLRSVGINSIGVVNVILDIETEFGIAIPNDRITAANFFSLKSVAALMTTLLAAGTS